MTPRRSITETPNPLSSNIDLASPTGILRILRQTDAQVFAGYSEFSGLLDEETINRIVELAIIAAEVIASDNGVIVMTGAGTSGRLAMLAAKALNTAANKMGQRQACRYLIAGGHAALIQAQEGAEDDPHQGQTDLREAIGPADCAMLIGITCGFSAPYIAGQLEMMLESAGGTAVLVGFNPVDYSRDTPIEGWPHTFLHTARRVAEASNGFLLNPVVGPEPVTGSTRMKSGTATKILLEILLHTAYEIAGRRLRSEDAPQTVRAFLSNYSTACRDAYFAIPALAGAVDAAGQALRNGRRITYLGPDSSPDGWINTGILGLVDASECPPTFGADFEDVRGFLEHGWQGLLPDEETNLSHHGGHFRISYQDFQDFRLPTIEEGDFVMALGTDARTHELLEAAAKRGAATAALARGLKPLGAVHQIRLSAPDHPVLGAALGEIQTKLVLNAITTGAHIMAGKVFGNRMIDLRISNNKLFHRTVGIIHDLMSVTQDNARLALIRAVFETDTPGTREMEAPISECIERAKTVEKVVPKALLMASGRFTYREASDALHRNPRVRGLLSETLS